MLDRGRLLAFRHVGRAWAETMPGVHKADISDQPEPERSSEVDEIGIREARARLAELVERAGAGESVLLRRSGPAAGGGGRGLAGSSGRARGRAPSPRRGDRAR